MGHFKKILYNVQNLLNVLKIYFPNCVVVLIRHQNIFRMSHSKIATKLCVYGTREHILKAFEENIVLLCRQFLIARRKTRSKFLNLIQFLTWPNLLMTSVSLDSIVWLCKQSGKIHLEWNHFRILRCAKCYTLQECVHSLTCNLLGMQECAHSGNEFLAKRK